jgi:hypothetical protein
MDGHTSWTTALDENDLPRPSDGGDEFEDLHSDGQPSTPLVPSQLVSLIVSSTGRKHSPSDTPLPKGRASEKKPKSRALPAHTPAKPASSKFAKVSEVFSKLDSRMGDILSIIQTPKPALTIKDTPHHLTNAVTLARRECVWLPIELIMRFTDLLEEDRNVVVTYLTMEDEKDLVYWRAWILQKLKITMPAGYDLSQDIIFPM